MNKLIELAKSLGWLVWAYDVPDSQKIGGDALIGKTKRIYMLKSPLNVPFNDGKPVVAKPSSREASGEDIAFGAQFTVHTHDDELDAWLDLPQTEDEIRAYSEWGDR